MALIKATGWNWFSQIYIAIAGIAIIPIYMRHFGDEAYGLIAFMLTLQMFMSLLDIGFSASLSRESSKLKANQIDVYRYNAFLRIVLTVFLVTGLLFSSVIFIFSSHLAEGWLNFRDLDVYLVSYVLKISAFIIFFRWLSVFYRSVIFGYEDLVWVAKFTIFMATLRFLMVLPLIYYFSLSVVDYFYYQLAIQIIELVILFIRKKIIFPAESGGAYTVFIKDAYFKETFNFICAAGGATVLWLLISQLDRFYASAFLSLKDYGYYHTAVMAAGMITIITAPLVSSMQPRVTILFSLNDMAGVEKILKNLFDFMTVLGVSLVMVVYFFGYDLLRTWHGEKTFADSVYLVFLLHCISMAILGINSCSYIVDYASGKLRLRNKISILMLVLLVSLYPLAFHYFSAIGAAVTWLTLNLLYAVFAQPRLLAQHDSSLYFKVLKETLIPRFLQSVVLFFVVLLVSWRVDLSDYDNVFIFISLSVLFWLSILLIFLFMKIESRRFLISYISRFYVSAKN